MKKIFSSLFILGTLTAALPVGYAQKAEPTPAPAAATQTESEPRPAAASSLVQTKMKALVLALHNHQAVRDALPPAFSVDADGKPLHSWRVHLLPFLDETALYDKIRLNEPWNSEWNAQFHSQTPEIFAAPNEPELAAQGLTRFGVVGGEETAFQGGEKGLTIDDIKDGASNTVAFIERKTPVNWMAPDQELTFEELQKDGSTALQERPEGFFVALFNGAVRVLPKTIATEKLEAHLTRGGIEAFLIQH